MVQAAGRFLGSRLGFRMWASVEKAGRFFPSAPATHSTLLLPTTLHPQTSLECPVRVATAMGSSCILSCLLGHVSPCH